LDEQAILVNYLGGNADRAGVGVALAHHDAALMIRTHQHLDWASRPSWYITWVAMPTGQVLVWHLRIMMQPS